MSDIHSGTLTCSRRRNRRLSPKITSTCIKTLFPTKEIDNIERTALSIGMSLALVPLIGLLLNYTPWGIRRTPVTLSLLALTIALTITGLIREHQAKTKQPV